MKEISHANPYTGETAGQLFRRGPVVAADGGRRGAVAPEEGDDEEAAKPKAKTMKDVSHTPPNASEDANRVFERGSEARRAPERPSGQRPRGGREQVAHEE